MENLNNPDNKYLNGKIYKITDVAYTECYIGSTVQSLCNRMADHRFDYKSKCKNERKVFCSSFSLFDKYGLENCKIELVELFPCQSKAELERREGYWIKHETCVNKFVAGRTHREYLEDNRERILESLRQYNIQNKEQIGVRRKKHRLDNNYNEQRKEKTTCTVCGSCFRKWDNNRHEKSKKHIAALENNK
jgi:adenylate kinase family enzyme